jgi:DivIVA domain-containing protein
MTPSGDPKDEGAGVEQHTIDRIRSATFKEARRGYERREVDNFLAGLADWLEGGGGDQVRSETVKRELERIGEKTANILAAAEDTAESLRREADEETIRLIESAKAKARRIIEEGEQRRGDLEAIIADLVRRRDGVLAEIERLQGQLQAAVVEHRPTGADPFARPTQLDPGERTTAPPAAATTETEPKREARVRA